MILSRVRLIPSQRYDLEDFLAQQSAARADSKYHTREFFSGDNYILKGFKVAGIGLKEASIDVTNGTLLNANGSYDFSYFIVDDATTSITVTDAELEDGYRNYLELELITETGTNATKALWDSGANAGAGAEFNQEIDTMYELSVQVVVSTGGFSGSADRIPVAIVDVDGSGNITGILDKRDMFFRLAKASDLTYEYPWSSTEEPSITLTIASPSGSYTTGEQISFTSGATATCTQGGTTSIKVNFQDSDSFVAGDTVTGVDSGTTGTLSSFQDAFIGADKDINDFRGMIEAFATELKNMKGTPSWFTQANMSNNGLAAQMNSVLVQAVIDAKYSWDGSELSITDDSGTPADADVLAYLKLFGNSNTLSVTRQDATSATIPIAEEEIVFIKLPDSGDRIYSGVGSGDTNFQVVAIADYEVSDNNYWIGYRKLNRLYIRGYGEMEAGEEVVISDPQKEDILASIAANQTKSNQDRSSKVIGGGTWSWDLGTTTLTWSADAYVQVPGLANSVNTIAAASDANLDADGKVLYVAINRTGPGGSLTVQSGAIDSLTLSDDLVIIARRVGNDVIVGTNSFTLEDNDFLTLDGAKAELDRRLDQLKVNPAQPNSTRIIISASDIIQLNGSTLSLEQRNLLLKFDGAQIDFNTGEVFEDDGTTPFLAGANDFTPETIPASEYFYYSVSLLPNATNADNTISGQMLVIPASASNAVLASAPKAAFPSSGIKLANVYVQRNVGDTAIENIDYANITSLGVGGSGSGGSGDATSDETSYRDRLSYSAFDYANLNIASVDEDGQLDGSSTATYDIPNSQFKFDDSTAQILLSTSQLDSDFLAEGEDLSAIELLSIWNIDNIDTSATYEVSRDGGGEWQAVTMSRVDNTDLYRGFHTFADEAANAFNQEYAVANADAIRVFNDTTAQEISQKFTVANTTVYKNLLAYINKNDANAAGKYYISIVADDSGSPSTDNADIIFLSAAQNVSDLSVGNNVVNLAESVILTPGDYHLVIETDDEYKTTYNSNSAYNIGARVDSSSGPTPNLRDFNGTVWSAEVTDNTMVYRLEGRELDLLVRITSSATAGEKFLSSYAIMYGMNLGVEYIGTKGDTLLSDNHLGSLDGAADRSVAGRGILLRRPDGTLREISIDDDDNIIISSI